MWKMLYEFNNEDYRRSVFWIDQWRNQTIKLSKELDRFQCYVEVESLENKKLRRPTVLTQYLPLMFVVVWLSMMVLVVLKVVI